MKPKVEILGYQNGKTITLCFVDVVMKNTQKLYHRNFYVGPERSVCIDEKNEVYLVGIDTNESGLEELYEMVNTTVQMLKIVSDVDLSKYQNKYFKENNKKYRKEVNQVLFTEEDFNKDLAMEIFKTRVENGELTKEEKERLEEIIEFNKNFNIDDYL